MKTKVYIRSFSFGSFLAIPVLLLIAFGCAQKEELPAKKIYKAKPVNSLPGRLKLRQDKKETPDTVSVKAPIDSLQPEQKNLKDTTESMHQQEKKPEIRTRKKYYYFSIYKKPLIT